MYYTAVDFTTFTDINRARIIYSWNTWYNNKIDIPVRETVQYSQYYYNCISQIDHMWDQSQNVSIMINFVYVKYSTQ